MAYISFKPKDYFSNTNYQGNGSTQTITNNVDSDLVWLKGTTFSDNHNVFDSVRGANKYISPDGTAAESTTAAPNLGVTAFNSNGFDLGAWSALNRSGEQHASYAWKGGTTSVPSGGSITPSACSYSATSGFGIYKWTGTATNGTIAHGLGAIPTAIWIKNLSTTDGWHCYFQSAGNAKVWYLNTNAAPDASSTAWNSTTPTTTNFTIGTAGGTNGSGNSFIAYVFADKPGFFKSSSWKGNGVDGKNAFIYTGFKPDTIVYKTEGANDWRLMRWKSRGPNTASTSTVPVNPVDYFTACQVTTAEATSGAGSVDIFSNGFQMKHSHAVGGGSGTEYHYMAWASESIVSSNNIPTLAR